jgi:hypothetical protein
MPLAVGYSSPHEVHESIRVWRQIRQGADDEGRRAKEVEVAKVFEEDMLKNYSWACP